MERNDPVEIVRVHNGYIVNCALVMGGPTSETHVFQSLEGMLDWLAEHFEVVPVPGQETWPAATVPDSVRENHERMQARDGAICRVINPPEPMPATEIERRMAEHWDGIAQQRERFEAAARQRFIDAFGLDAMTDAEARARGG